MNLDSKHDFLCSESRLNVHATEHFHGRDRHVLVRLFYKLLQVHARSYAAYIIICHSFSILSKPRQLVRVPARSIFLGQFPGAPLSATILITLVSHQIDRSGASWFSSLKCRRPQKITCCSDEQSPFERTTPVSRDST